MRRQTVQRGGSVALASVLSVSAVLAAAAKAVEPVPEHTPNAGPASQNSRELSFDPTTCRHMDRVDKHITLTDAEREMFKRQGFVVANVTRHQSFPLAYYEIYAKDMPVMISSDSILHAVHRAFDETLRELEEQVLCDSLAKVLEGCHAELARRVAVAGDTSPFADNHKDLDFYLSVARALLAGPSKPATLSHCGLDGAVQQMLQQIDAERLPDPMYDRKTALYGGSLHVDFSQFRPRGHYTKSQRLKDFFRTLMWLGRADTGFFIGEAHVDSGITTDPRRGFRDAVLLTDLLRESKQLERLDELDRAIEFLVGQSDNLRPVDLSQMMDAAGIKGLADLADGDAVQRLRTTARTNPRGQQRICSQIINASKDRATTMPLPDLFQAFGQRYMPDSDVFASVVHDQVRLRFMPSGLDAMAALGNPLAWELLEPELAKFSYAGRLKSLEGVVARELADDGRPKSLFYLWLDTLRTLHADMSGERLFPEVMRGRAWQHKQLHTQLASWAELRHDGILFIKQSYTKFEECEYPSAYVEPYPEFYAHLCHMAERAATGFGEMAQGEPPGSRLRHYEGHWRHVAGVMAKLEGLARKELKGEPFTAEEENFLKRTVEIQTFHDRGCAILGEPDTSFCAVEDEVQLAMAPRKTERTIRRYSGWYCGLFYPPNQGMEDFCPTVADVHTDPNAGGVLEVGAGHARFALVAVNSGDDRVVYVTPVSTYYEFTSRTRMTDEEFKAALHSGRELARPGWVGVFEAR